MLLASVFVGASSASTAVGLSGATAQADEPSRLYVFINSGVKPHALQKELEDHMAGVSVTVFGRFRDFQTASIEETPDAVLATGPVLDELGFARSLQGFAGSSADEPYVLVAIGQALTPAAAAGFTIGSVDLLGRTKMRTFVAKLLNVDTSVKLKLVTKTEDLLPLLQFSAAQAVILPERERAAFIARSELDLRSTVLPTRVGLPAASAITIAGTKILTAIKGLDRSTMSQLGVESWR